MKFSPTATLALALAAGMVGAAAAQTAATSDTTSTGPQTTAPMSAGSTTSQGQPGYAQPQGNAAQAQPGYSQAQPSFGQAQTPNNANEQVRTAQQQLRAAGLYNGPVDGVMDPDTRAAIARFQQQNGLQATQSLDQQTLARLMSSQPGGSQSGAPAPADPTSTGTKRRERLSIASRQAFVAIRYNHARTELRPWVTASIPADSSFSMTDDR